MFFDPDTGDVLICDNDNVSANGIDNSSVYGTPRFMAPEIVMGQAKPSRNTDLYSLAVLLFYMFTIPPMTDRALPPVIVLLSDGQPTDDYKKSLDKLLHLPWGKKAVRIAISIGQDADDDVLQQFTGNRELVLQANNPQALVKMIKWASTAASLVSAPASRPKEMDVVPAGNNTPSATNAPLVLDMNNIPDPGSIGANDVW